MNAEPPLRAANRCRLFTPLVLAGVLAVAVVVALNLPEPHRARADLTDGSKTALTVSDSVVGPPIPSGFVGFSLEFPALPAYAGPDPQHLNPVFAQLVQNLVPGQSPVLRIGGDSTDVTWWPVRGVGRPNGITYSLSPAWLATARALADRMRALLILGINLKAGRFDLSLAEARAMLSSIGRRRIAALEFGNEPGLYGRFPFYRNRQGHLVNARPRSYGLPAFTREFSTLAQMLPGVPLAGPTLGVPPPGAELARFLAAEPSVRIATLHRYPLNRCFSKPSSPKFPTTAHLLAPYSSSGLVASLGNSVGIAHRAGVPLQIDELNSVACSGKRGISDTFASALWAVDELFGMARAGVAGVNLHTFPGATYAPFAFSRPGEPRMAAVYPMYYGLLMFTLGAPPGSRLLQLTGSTETLSTWATRPRDGRLRVTLINKETQRTQVVRLRLPGRPGSASVLRLQAPSARSTADVTIGGQSFGDHTFSGRLPGAPETQSLTPHGGVYSVVLPPASAALVQAPSA